jgi:sialate O-acetylesterase
MTSGYRRVFLFFFLLITLAQAQVSIAAGLSLPALFSDHMVLQFGQVIPIWGWADAGEKVNVTFRHFAVETTADSQGRWRVEIGPLDAGGPDRLVIAAGDEVIVIDDVLAGEVWLCSGQSNMAMTVNRCLDAEQEISSANFPQIRQFKVPNIKELNPQQDFAKPDSDDNQAYQCKWQQSTPETTARFTAAGYFFARSLHQHLGNIPIGLINSSWGGSLVEAWISRSALEKNSEIAPILNEWPDYTRHRESWRNSYKNYLEELEKAKADGSRLPVSSLNPAVMYNGMIAPLVGYGMRGVIWYQGESNRFRPIQYSKLFQALISDWRDQWGRDFPFLWVQLPNWDNPLQTWPLLRESQAAALNLPGTAMAVTIDVGERWDIHPRNKQAVGNRLAIAARKLVYLEKLPHMGPLLESMTVEGNRCLVKLNNSGDSLATSDGNSPRCFEVAGKDQRFFPAEAVIKGAVVQIWSPEVTAPLAVRYAWANNPDNPNLYSTFRGKTWLPAAPFRTDSWDAMPALELID